MEIFRVIRIGNLPENKAKVGELVSVNIAIDEFKRPVNLVRFHALASSGTSLLKLLDGALFLDTNSFVQLAERNFDVLFNHP